VRHHGQLELPFLSAERAEAITAALDAIQRSHGAAIVSRRHAEAAELGRIGAKLIMILEDNAAAVRANVPADNPAAAPTPSGEVDQAVTGANRRTHPEPTQ